MWRQCARRIKRLRQRGQTNLEYAIIVAFIAIAAVAVMRVLGPAIGQAFDAVTEIL